MEKLNYQRGPTAPRDVELPRAFLRFHSFATAGKASEFKLVYLIGLALAKPIVNWFMTRKGQRVVWPGENRTTKGD